MQDYDAKQSPAWTKDKYLPKCSGKFGASDEHTVPNNLKEAHSPILWAESS